MSKVLVERELLERAAAHLEWDGSGPMTTIQFAQKCDALADELRSSIAQLAEAEGVSALDELLALFPLKIDKQAFVVNGGAPLTADGDDEFLSFKKVDAALGQIRQLAEQTRAALSAVTAERDRLREEMGILWKRIDKYENQSHGITALAEIERLRAEVEALSSALHGCIELIETLTPMEGDVIRKARAALAAKEG